MHGPVACPIGQNRKFAEEVGAVDALPRTSLPSGSTIPQLLWVLAAKGSQLELSPKNGPPNGRHLANEVISHPTPGAAPADNGRALWYRRLAAFLKMHQPQGAVDAPELPPQDQAEDLSSWALFLPSLTFPTPFLLRTLPSKKEKKIT